MKKCNTTEDPEGLMSLIIPYWVANPDAFQIVSNRVRKPVKNKLQRYASNLNAKNMKRELINYYKNVNRDEAILHKLVNSKINKGDFDIPDCLVSMMFVYWEVSGIDPLLVT